LRSPLPTVVDRDGHWTSARIIDTTLGLAFHHGLVT